MSFAKLGKILNFRIDFLDELRLFTEEKHFSTPKNKKKNPSFCRRSNNFGNYLEQRWAEFVEGLFFLVSYDKSCEI
jgi:hypothetical protein